jgi:hypothetical protein
MAGAIQSERKISGNSIEVTTLPCMVCGTRHTFTLNYGAYMRWQRGQYVQDCFPEMSPGDREILINGTCDECFNQLFPAEDLYG